MKDTYRGILGRDEWRQPFALTAVPPSGRRPRPIATTETDQDYADGKPIGVQFTYPVHFVPAGKRKPVVARVKGRGFVTLRTVSNSSIELACRIRRNSGRNETTDVVHCDRKFWWSLPGRPTVRHFAAALAMGDPSAVGVLNRNCVSTMAPATSIGDLDAREIIYDGSNDCVVGLQRGAEGILVSGDLVFLRDGPPLYVLWNEYWNNSIISIGTSRVVGEFAGSRPNPAYDDALNELVFGRPFEATDQKGAIDFAKEKGLHLEKKATIELVRPEWTRQDPMKIQLEAILQKLLQLISIPRAGTEEGQIQIRAERRRLGDLLERDGSVYDRAECLKEFQRWTCSQPRSWMDKFRIEKLFVLDAIDRIEAECIRRGRPSFFSAGLLNPEDDAAFVDYFNRAAGE